jgi:hypothetical protein
MNRIWNRQDAKVAKKSCLFFLWRKKLGVLAVNFILLGVLRDAAGLLDIPEYMRNGCHDIKVWPLTGTRASGWRVDTAAASD